MDIKEFGTRQNNVVWSGDPLPRTGKAASRAPRNAVPSCKLCKNCANGYCGIMQEDVAEIAEDYWKWCRQFWLADAHFTDDLQSQVSSERRAVREVFTEGPVRGLQRGSKVNSDEFGIGYVVELGETEINVCFPMAEDDSRMQVFAIPEAFETEELRLVFRRSARVNSARPSEIRREKDGFGSHSKAHDGEMLSAYKEHEDDDVPYDPRQDRIRALKDRAQQLEHERNAEFKRVNAVRREEKRAERTRRGAEGRQDAGNEDW